jgi:hypothetical protein
MKSGHTATAIARVPTQRRRLEPLGHDSAGLAYFEHLGLCSFSTLLLQMRNFSRPCTIADSSGPTTSGVLLRGDIAVATSTGGAHLDADTHEIELTPHAQAWLLIERRLRMSPGTPQVARYATSMMGQAETGIYEARAIFDVP